MNQENVNPLEKLVLTEEQQKYYDAGYMAGRRSALKPQTKHTGVRRIRDLAYAFIATPAEELGDSILVRYIKRHFEAEIEAARRKN